VVDFKHFLEFAENGARAKHLTDVTRNRPFEDAVMRALQDKGWQVHPQPGVSFFRFHLGIVPPDFPGRYMAGVECDGAAYHRSATARAARLRKMVLLTDAGWRIQRIWSTEWWMDSSAAAEMLHARLAADLRLTALRVPRSKSGKKLASAGSGHFCRRARPIGRRRASTRRDASRSGSASSPRLSGRTMTGSRSRKPRSTRARANNGSRRKGTGAGRIRQG
jgi:hypothetical protein